MKYLIVVDMQNDFINGALGTGEAEAIVSKVAKKINDYKEEGNRVIFTRDTHSNNYLETREGKALPVKHCIINTDGWEISDKLDTAHSTIINKPTFGSLEMIDFIKAEIETVDQIELVGVCTDICVVTNALLLKTNFPEIPIIVDAACCAGVTPKTHQYAIETMKMCQVKVME